MLDCLSKPEAAGAVNVHVLLLDKGLEGGAVAVAAGADKGKVLVLVGHPRSVPSSIWLQLLKCVPCTTTTLVGTLLLTVCCTGLPGTCCSKKYKSLCLDRLEFFQIYVTYAGQSQNKRKKSIKTN